MTSAKKRTNPHLNIFFYFLNNDISCRLLQLILACLCCCSSADANVIGPDLQNFHPTPNGMDFVTVHSSETLNAGLFHTAFFVNRAQNNSIFDINNNLSNPTFTHNDRALWTAELVFAVGLRYNWELGLSLPQVISDQEKSPSGTSSTEGLREYRVSAQHTLWKSTDESHGLAGLLHIGFNQIRNNPTVGRSSRPIFTGELIYDYDVTPSDTFAINIGYRLRSQNDPIPQFGSDKSDIDNAGKVDIAPFRSQWIGSMGISHYWESFNTGGYLEIVGSYPSSPKSPSQKQRQSSLELLLGLHHELKQDFSLYLGLGSTLSTATATPEWRFFAGLSYDFGPLFAADPNVNDDDIFSHSAHPSDRHPDQLHNPVQTTQQQKQSQIAQIYIFEHMDPESELGEKIMDALTAELRKNTSWSRLQISSHTDSVGSADKNLRQSQRRAYAAKKYLVEFKGIPSESISAYGYGETQPRESNAHFSGRLANDRIEFEIININK